ncbi:prolyl oligopeptidase family protein [Geothrix sp. 21YS21S-4]|uniref:prolyl oligopeptidase family serine peptidase n=1 Tax=Geothrix sp. 21YS21S-4 TaxID=3068889 RepID=UPI0027B8FA38|nr:prolyl oligopeptidase family serine peptidase [Geothrix sp. 21YS21S-4]
MRILPMALVVTTGLAAHVPLVYPSTRKAEVVEDFFGTKVADPYRWLEDDNSPETKAWVEAQNRVTFAYLEGIPERARLRERMTKLWNYERYGVPYTRGGNTFYTHNTGLQNQAVLFVTDDPAKAGRVLLDPNTLSKDGTVALSGTSLTDDGRLMAYSISRAGSDWQTWKVRDVATGQDLADEIRWSKFSGAAWTKDGKGFFYSRYDAPKEGDALTGVNKFQKVYFHQVGTPQEKDELVYERKDQPDWGFGADVSEDGRWLIISQSEGTERRNRVFLKDLTKPGAAVEPFLDAFDAQYQVVGNEGDVFFLLTDKGAPRSRLVAAPFRTRQAWRELIPEGKGRDVLSAVSLVGDTFVATWMRDAHSAVSFHAVDGKLLGDLALPTLGTVDGFDGRRKDATTYYAFTSFARPATIYRLDLKTRQSVMHRTPQVDFDPSAYEVEQVFYPSKDGTKIPMFLVHKKGLKRDGQNPTLLYGYGGFDVSLTPAFSVSRVVWLEMGGIYAMPNLRGGGEYGKPWHDAGRLENKQNVFDDFIAAAEWLIANKYTSTPKLAINGGSNGGLLVGACLTQRPDLFGAAVPEVGVMDLLRYHKFTIGWAWKSDYLVSDTKAGFQGLMKYSPLHTLKPGVKYPPTLVTTGDHDDRVVPAHSHKFTATLQACQGGSAPVLTRIETNAGHGAGKPTAKQIEERADVFAFLVKNLGMKLP